MTNPGPDGWHGPLPDIEIPDVSLYDLLFAGLTSADAAKPAVVDHASGVTLTLGEVKHQTDAFAAWLSASGIRAGDAVGVLLPNGPDYLAAFHGIARAGAATSPVNATSTAPEIARPVSYTHLDVYKRQAGTCRGCGFPPRMRVPAEDAGSRRGCWYLPRMLPRRGSGTSA